MECVLTNLELLKLKKLPVDPMVESPLRNFRKLCMAPSTFFFFSQRPLRRIISDDVSGCWSWTVFITDGQIRELKLKLIFIFLLSIFFYRFADSFGKYMKLLLLILLACSTGFFVWFTLLCLKVLQQSDSTYTSRRYYRPYRIRIG